MRPNLYHSPRLILFFSMLALAALACSLLPSGAGEEPATPILDLVDPTDPPPAGDIASNDCNHPFFPVAIGNQWTYFSGESAVGPFGWTDSITDLRADGFTLTGEFTDLTRVQEWACGPDGLAALSLGGGSAASVSTGGVNMQMQTSNVEGLTLPASITPGDTWSHTLTFSGVIDNGDGTTSEIEGSASSTFMAIGLETVTVPAGTFEAMRIDQDLTLAITVSIGDLSVPTEITGISSIWYVEGVGWVKSSSTGTIFEEPFAEMIELTAFTLP